MNAVYFSDSIVDACRKFGIPIVWRISDFHKVCANYLLYRDGKTCEECLNKSLSRAIRNRCGGYQHSLGASMVKVAGMSLSRMRHAYDHVNYFITPSTFTREKLIQGGLPANKIKHIPTWVTLPEQTQATSTNKTPYILYVGRLSYEKGVDTLLKAFEFVENKDCRLILIGDDSSSYAAQLKASVPADLAPRIDFIGYKNHEEIAEYYRNASCFVIPSVWYENQPNVVLEGMAYALPPVVSDHGSLSELISDGETGYRFVPGDSKDLAFKLNKLLQSPEKAKEIGLQAREYVKNHHSMSLHLASLDKLFEECVR